MMITLYGLVTLALIIAFIWLCVWAYSPRMKVILMRDGNIPFMDEAVENGSVGGVRHE